MKQEARRKNLPGKIWDVLYPTAALVLCMLIITMAALMLAGWITGKQSADSRELMEAVPGLSLWVSGGFYGAALLTQRKQYALDALQFDEPEKRWRAKKRRRPVSWRPLWGICSAQAWNIPDLWNCSQVTAGRRPQPLKDRICCS